MQCQAMKSAHGEARVLLVVGNVSPFPFECQTLQVDFDLCFAFKYFKERGKLINHRIIDSQTDLGWKRP